MQSSTGGSNGVKAMRKRIGNLEFDRASHCVYHLTVHLVFCTKLRRHTLTPERLDRVNRSIRRKGEELKCEVIEFVEESDHIVAISFWGAPRAALVPESAKTVRVPGG